jgi:hypothetical protein
MVVEMLVVVVVEEILTEGVHPHREGKRKGVGKEGAVGTGLRLRGNKAFHRHAERCIDM